MLEFAVLEYSCTTSDGLIVQTYRSSSTGLSSCLELLEAYSMECRTRESGCVPNEGQNAETCLLTPQIVHGENYRLYR